MGTGTSVEEEKSGWRVLKVMPTSPCDQLGLVPYFDVLTHVNGNRLNSHQASLLGMITEGTPTKLTVLNYPQKKSREVTVVPSRNWNGSGLLGLILRFDCYENADEDVMHVLEVYANSPAQIAGLQPGSDYLLGTAEIAFKGYEHLDYFLEKFENKTTSMFVFNSQTYRVREILVTPNSKWGGQGSLGCNLGLGLLHRLPLHSKSPLPVSLETSTGPSNNDNSNQSSSDTVTLNLHVTPDVTVPLRIGINSDVGTSLDNQSSIITSPSSESSILFNSVSPYLTSSTLFPSETIPLSSVDTSSLTNENSNEGGHVHHGSHDNHDHSHGQS